MDKTVTVVTVVQQVVRLGALWVAVCASLILAVGYTKSGLETLLGDHLAQSPPAVAPTPARAGTPQPLIRAQRPL